MTAATRLPDFLAKNPNGRVPLLELDDGRFLPSPARSSGISREGSNLLPDDNWGRAQAHQWMFFEQYSHEPYVAVARFLAYLLAGKKERRKEAICSECACERATRRWL